MVVEEGLGLGKWGPCSGGRLLERPSPREQGPPTHSPQEQPRPQPGQGRAGLGRASQAGDPGHVERPPRKGPDSPVGDQAGSSGGLGGSRAREKSPGPACLPLPHLLGRLSVTRGRGGGPGGGRLLIGSSAEAGGAVQPQLGSARRAGAGAGRPIPGRKHAQPRLPTPSLGITQPATVSSRGLAG